VREGALKAAEAGAPATPANGAGGGGARGGEGVVAGGGARAPHAGGQEESGGGGTAAAAIGRGGSLARFRWAFVDEEGEAGGGQSENGRTGREGEMRNGRLRVVTEARVTVGRRGLFYSVRCLRWARSPARSVSLLFSSPSLAFCWWRGASLFLVARGRGWLAGWRARTSLTTSHSPLPPPPPGPWGRCAFDPDGTGPVVSGLGWFREGSSVRGLARFALAWEAGITPSRWRPGPCGVTVSVAVVGLDASGRLPRGHAL
jgi:hypothetical protein